MKVNVTIYRFTHCGPGFVKSVCSHFTLLFQMLSRLLNSSHPEDLKAANNLIKEMVQEVKLAPLFPPFVIWHVCVAH